MRGPPPAVKRPAAAMPGNPGLARSPQGEVRSNSIRSQRLAKTSSSYLLSAPYDHLIIIKPNVPGSRVEVHSANPIVDAIKLTKFNSPLRTRSPSAVKRASVPRIVVRSPVSVTAGWGSLGSARRRKRQKSRCHRRIHLARRKMLSSPKRSLSPRLVHRFLCSPAVEYRTD